MVADVRSGIIKITQIYGVRNVGDLLIGEIYHYERIDEEYFYVVRKNLAAFKELASVNEGLRGIQFQVPKNVCREMSPEEYGRYIDHYKF